MAQPIKDLVTRSGRKVNVRPDTLDFRDRMFAPTLVEVPPVVDLREYRRFGAPILDQGTEGACTGFGLASVVNYLLRTRDGFEDKTPVSPWMLYQLAKRYDEWPGENYDGSSARGAMKGWHKHGVCSKTHWEKGGSLTPKAAGDAVARPLGAYYRVNHKDLVAMHCAIAEVGILYATATVHAGWDDVGSDGVIKMSDEILGGHAFAIVAYDKEGFWLQNSWGPGWGKEGFAHISYDDWLANGTDVWVARLGAPVAVRTSAAVATRHSAATTYTDALSLNDLRRHIVSIGNDGALSPGGTYGTGEEDVRHIFEHHIPAVTANWQKKRILLYAHGGLVDEESSVQRLADYLPALLQSEVYPVSFIWHSDFWTTLTNILKDAVSRRRPEGILDAAKDFMLDRLDDALEPIARIPGKVLWNEMKENAAMSTTNSQGGARIALKSLEKLLRDPSDPHRRTQRRKHLPRPPHRAADRSARQNHRDLHPLGPRVHRGALQEELPAGDQQRQDRPLCALHTQQQGRAGRQLRQDLQQVTPLPGLQRLRGGRPHPRFPRRRADPRHGEVRRRRPATQGALHGQEPRLGPRPEQRRTRHGPLLNRAASRRLRRRRSHPEGNAGPHPGRGEGRGAVRIQPFSVGAAEQADEVVKTGKKDEAAS